MIEFKIENLGQLRSLRRAGIRGSEVDDRSRVDTCGGNPQSSETVPFAAVRRLGERELPGQPQWSQIRRTCRAGKGFAARLYITPNSK